MRRKRHRDGSIGWVLLGLLGLLAFEGDAAAAPASGAPGPDPRPLGGADPSIWEDVWQEWQREYAGASNAEIAAAYDDLVDVSDLSYPGMNTGAAWIAWKHKHDPGNRIHLTP